MKYINRPCNTEPNHYESPDCLLRVVVECGVCCGVGGVSHSLGMSLFQIHLETTQYAAVTLEFDISERL